jgi:hypothetical protein
MSFHRILPAFSGLAKNAYRPLTSFTPIELADKASGEERSTSTSIDYSLHASTENACPRRCTTGRNPTEWSHTCHVLQDALHQTGGVFQCLSAQAFARHPQHQQGIIAQIQVRFDSDGVPIGDGWQVIAMHTLEHANLLKPSDGTPMPVNSVVLEITHADGRHRRLTVTEAGIDFSQRHWSESQIEAADRILDAHCLATASPQPAVILSHAGVGRAAVMFCLAQLRHWTLAHPHASDADLYKALDAFVESERRKRGPQFMHTPEQFDTVLRVLQQRNRQLRELPERSWEFDRTGLGKPKLGLQKIQHASALHGNTATTGNAEPLRRKAVSMDARLRLYDSNHVPKRNVVGSSVSVYSSEEIVGASVPWSLDLLHNTLVSRALDHVVGGDPALSVAVIERLKSWHPLEKLSAWLAAPACEIEPASERPSKLAVWKVWMKLATVPGGLDALHRLNPALKWSDTSDTQFEIFCHAAQRLCADTACRGSFDQAFDSDPLALLRLAANNSDVSATAIRALACAWRGDDAGHADQAWAVNAVRNGLFSTGESSPFMEIDRRLRKLGLWVQRTSPARKRWNWRRMRIPLKPATYSG